jgi:hypothetical protein
MKIGRNTVFRVPCPSILFAFFFQSYNLQIPTKCFSRALASPCDLPACGLRWIERLSNTSVTVGSSLNEPTMCIIIFVVFVVFVVVHSSPFFRIVKSVPRK